MERKTAKTKEEMNEVKVNPLKKEKIYVRWIPKDDGLPKNHVLSGGKADGTYVYFVVPTLRSTGQYKNILTNAEKDYLEEVLGLDYNALSVYKKENNYWDNYKVRIDDAKVGLHLDLSDPEDYLKYKVLLANSDFVAPSVQERIDRFKNTYQFEMVRESEEDAIETNRMDAKMQSYKEFGKIENDQDTMRVLVELLDGRPYAANEKAVFLKEGKAEQFYVRSGPSSVELTGMNLVNYVNNRNKKGKRFGSRGLSSSSTRRGRPWPFRGPWR